MEKGKYGIVRVSASKWVAVQYDMDTDEGIPFFKYCSALSAKSHSELISLKATVKLINEVGPNKYIEIRNANPDKFRY